MRHNRFISIFVIASLLFSATVGPLGCGDSKPVVKHPPLQGEGSSFFGDMVFKVLKGLFSGSVDEIGSFAMGQILNLLFGGGPDDQGSLDAMSTKLDQIVSLLTDIENELQKLFLQLKITEEQILANTNDPTNAITQIKSSHDELQGLSKNRAGSVKTGDISNFVTRVENIYNIYAQVNAIYDAIIPPTVVKAPVLDNLTDLNINKGNSITDSYLTLEKYFSQLLYYQMEGVNLLVETKTYRKKAGLSQIDGRDAKQYMDFFMQNKLHLEVDNFMNNTYRLIMKRVDLLDSANFLPSEAEGVLSRANFFRVQSLNQDHFGLRGTLIATQDLVSSVILVKARNRQTGQTYSGSGNLFTASGKTYDYWDGNKVKPISAYTVIEYDFGNAPLGDYDILDANGNVIGTAKVQSFNDNYTLDASGTINYGHFTISKRVGAKDAFDKNPSWQLRWYTDQSSTVWGSTTGNKFVKVATNTASAMKYEYYGQLFANLRFDGAPVVLCYSVHVIGQAKASVHSVGAYESTIKYRISLWDQTNNSIVREMESGEVTAIATNYQDNVNNIDTKVIGSFTFTNPTIGNEYHMLLHTEIASNPMGIGSAEGWIQIDQIDVYITYDENMCR